MNDYLKRTWAEINLDYLNYNISEIKSKLPVETKVMGVVKADGYGHGDRIISKELILNGINFLAVSSLAEALSLRYGGIDCDILILGFTPANKASELARLNITQTIFSDEYAIDLSENAVKANCIVNVHIKLDTGMGRIGFVCEDTAQSVDKIYNIFKLGGLRVKGVFTHLSSADTQDTNAVEYTIIQVMQYNSIVNKLRALDTPSFKTHLQNSAGIAFLKDNEYDYARAGIVLYGIPPSNEPIGMSLRPVMSLKSVISMVKDVEQGRAISYGRTFVTDRTTRVATVPIGYADGYPRLLSNRGYMLVRGKRAPIIGNICMDQLLLDVSHIDGVAQDDVVTVVGIDGDETIGFWDLANMIGSIGYEMMCLIGRRVPRVYYKNGKRIAVIDYTQL